MTPSIGRVVHYYDTDTSTEAGPYAATITDVHATDVTVPPMEAVDLFVMRPNGFSIENTVFFAEEPTPGHWNWPPRV